MKRTIIASLLLTPVFLHAESVVYIDEDERVISEKGGVSSPSEPKILILNNQKMDQKSLPIQNSQISSQPVTRVTGVPISKNHATELRQSRRQAEIQTEQKIVERLESSRLRDEQERLNKILKPHNNKSVVVMNNGNNLYTEEAIVSQPEESSDEIFVGLHIGQASNLTNRIEESYGSFGISAGSYDESGLMLEGSVFYSQHEVSKDGFNMYYNNVYDRHLSPFSNVDQITGALSLKYTPFSRKFRPYVGVSVFYNMWMYDNEDDITNLYSFCPYGSYDRSGRSCNSSKKTTDSIDLGAHIGLDMKINKKVSLGFNLLVNIVNFYNNNTDVFSKYQLHYNNLYYDFHRSGIDIVNLEETNWVIASINAKMYF